MIILLSIITCLATLGGGFFALRFKNQLRWFLGFAAGAIIGMFAFDLLPEAIKMGNTQFPIITIISVVILGFVIYMILDRVMILNSPTKKDFDNAGNRGRLGAICLVTLSFLDGATMGLAFQISTLVGAVIATGIIVHDFSDGISTVGILVKDNVKNREAIKWLILDAVIPILGAISTFFFKLPKTFFGLALALFAGFFLYIGASDLLPESQKKYTSIWTTIMVILGIGTIYIAIILVVK
jgi:ZIP family zinc transporter